jgi:tetratricopeptide (TPR) repeat protein
MDVINGSPAVSASASAPEANPNATPPPVGTSQPTPEQMKQMADKQAEPLLAQLKTSPNDPDLLAKIGNIYYDTQQFPEAIKYYDEVLKVKPDNIDVRTDMGTAYHYMGQGDRALQEYDKVLKVNSKHANALFNQGMVRWQDKMDMQGAIESWKRLLATNPDYPKEKRDQVADLIAKVEQHLTMKPGTKTNKPAVIPQ